jgi:homoserine kinase
MRAAFARLGVEAPAVAVECVNRIPQARGLGSSSAAIVAGIQLARGLTVGRTMPPDDALRLAAELEGHPDNVAPCLLGGFTIAWTEPTGARAVRLTPADVVRPTVFVPGHRGLTEEARAALPEAVPHRDAAANAGRAALLVHALTAAPELLFAATEDRLHQRYRAPGRPATAVLTGRLRDAGVAAVVSGAGPAVLALNAIPPDFEPGIGWERLTLEVAKHGVRIEAESSLDTPGKAGVAAGRKS